MQNYTHQSISQPNDCSYAAERLPIISILIGLTAIPAIFIFENLRILWLVNVILLLAYSLSLFFHQRKRFSPIHIWVFATFFFLHSEIMSMGLVDPRSVLMDAIKYILVINWLILLSYVVLDLVVPPRQHLKLDRNVYKATHFTIAFIASLYVIFFAGVNPQLFGVEGLIIVQQFRNIMYYIGQVIPAFLIYYFLYLRNSKKGLFLGVLLSLPIITQFAMAGTRFRLGFALAGMGMIIIKKPEIELKTVIKSAIVIILFFFFFEVIRHHHTKLFVSQTYITTFEQSREKGLKFFSSSEGIVNVTRHLMDHFSTNEHLYGKSSSFIFYFWVPRAIWREKPEMLGYWFMRERGEIRGRGHSWAVGYWGDLYADFGMYIGGFLTIIIFSTIIYFIDRYSNYALQTKAPALIMTLFLFSYLFFSFRSPITSAYNLFLFIICYKIFIMTLRKTKIALPQQ